MRVDQKKFGKVLWVVVVERMEKFQYVVFKEILQMMRVKEICLEQRKYVLKEEVIKLLEKYIKFKMFKYLRCLFVDSFFKYQMK